MQDVETTEQPRRQHRRLCSQITQLVPFLTAPLYGAPDRIAKSRHAHRKDVWKIVVAVFDGFDVRLHPCVVKVSHQLWNARETSPMIAANVQELYRERRHRPAAPSKPAM